MPHHRYRSAGRILIAGLYRASRWVFVVEGEKDVDALLELGMVATCNPMGAGKWQDEYSDYLKGRRVAVIPDNDPEGHRHAEKVVGSLRGRAASVKLVHLPGLGNKGDISDWLSLGNDVLDLLDLVEETPMYLPIPTYGHEGEVRLHVISMLAVQPRSVEWVWPGRIPKGKFTIIGGDPGLGKSFLTLDISSRVSQGGIWPDGGTAPRGNVLLITVEDDLEDTVYPRLQQLEADMSRVYAINPIVEQDGREVLLSLAEHLAALERVIFEQQALLLVLDPLSAFAGRRTDTYRMSEVRAVLSPLAAMADRTRCAIVGVMHPNKRSSEMNSLYRMTSSLDFVAAARSVLAVGKHPMDPTRNVLASVKGNLSARPESLLFYIDDQGYFQWDGETDFDANAIMASPSNDHSARAEAKEFLKEFLAEGEVTANAVHEEADNRGIARATLYRAKMELKIGSVQLSTNGERGGRRWLWRLPPESEFS